MLEAYSTSRILEPLIIYLILYIFFFLFSRKNIKEFKFLNFDHVKLGFLIKKKGKIN